MKEQPDNQAGHLSQKFELIERRLPQWPWLLALFVLLFTPQFSFAGTRSFSALTVTPMTTNIAAGTTTTAVVALTTKTSGGNTAAGNIILYIDTNSTISDPSITTTINPNTNDIAVNSTFSTTLTVTTTAATPLSTYTFYVVGNTNPAAVNVLPITNTFTLTVTQGAPARPYISSLKRSGSSLTMTGSNGMATAQYIVVASTNLTTPFAQWVPVVTNSFDGNGNFNTSFGLGSTPSSNSPKQFFGLIEK